MARMRDIKSEAKNRREHYLKEYEKLAKQGLTITEYAEMQNPPMTRANMSRLINQAREDRKK
ncbi:MAG TPA: hypothetical protein VFM18_20680 [Methanosarcina sp.]|nr:hypothetical protein [Methanosarcina sp.]